MGVRLEEAQVESGCNRGRGCFGWEEVKWLWCCEQVLSCAAPCKGRKLLWEDPCIELEKMGCFKDSVRGLTLSFIISKCSKVVSTLIFHL